MRRPYWLLLVPLLAACTPAGLDSRPETAPAAPKRQAAKAAKGSAAKARAARDATPVAAVRGTAHVLGQPPEAVLALFGAASIDRTERDARHLQFGGGPCILDVYFHPEADGAPATARHVEARLVDGQNASADACIDRRLRDIAEEREAQAVS